MWRRIQVRIFIKKFKNKKIYGIDPSKMAIKKAICKGVLASIGTADHIPFKEKKFDIIIFGFCLYLIDDEDLFKVISEADRVLNQKGHIVIYDFYSKKTRYYPYKHCRGLKSRHMNYNNFLFPIQAIDWFLKENIFMKKEKL